MYAPAWLRAVFAVVLSREMFAPQLYTMKSAAANYWMAHASRVAFCVFRPMPTANIERPTSCACARGLFTEQYGRCASCDFCEAVDQFTCSIVCTMNTHLLYPATNFTTMSCTWHDCNAFHLSSIIISVLIVQGCQTYTNVLETWRAWRRFAEVTLGLKCLE